MTKYARSSRKVQENKVTLCDVGSSCNAQRNKKVTVLRSSNLSSEIHKCRPLSSFHALPADRRNKALECWLTTLKASSAIMSHALELINAARIGVICQSAVSKLPTSCLHGYSDFLPRNPPDCPCCNNSHVALERGEKCPFHPFSPFSLFSMASSLDLFVFGHGVETSHLGDVSAQELCQAIGDFSLEQVGIDVSAPCTHESNPLDVKMTKYARSSRKVQENKVTLCDVGASCNAQRNKKVTVLRSSNLSSEIHKWRPLSSCHALPADRRNKALECQLATLNASSTKMSKE